ncbi:MAG TPA: hypothetical protein VF636_10280 [Sphingomonas sp.]|jgi:hypothetical protein
MSAGEGEELLFDGEDVRVRVRLQPRSRDLVVTFTGRSSKPPVPKGFGEDFLAKRGVSAIHFISKANHWWQTPETDEAVALIKARGLLEGHERITLYGSSMGGFASMIQSRELGADHILVVSPQYSIDGAKVPFEKRWRGYAAALSFDHDDMPAGLDEGATLSAVVDPFFPPDMAHVRLIQRLRPVSLIPVSFAGHNTARVLEECGLMQRSLEALIDGRFDPAAFRTDYRQRRTEASLFWFGLAEALISRGRDAWAGGAAAIAADMTVKNARMRDQALRSEILRLGIRTAVARRDRASAAAWTEALKGIDTRKSVTLLAEAMLAALDDDHQAALEAAKRVRVERPRDADAAALAIDAMVRAGEVERAARLGSKVGPVQRRVGAVQLSIGRAQLAAGDAAGARETLQHAHRRGVAPPGALVLLAKDLVDRGKGPSAQKLLAPVIAGTLVDAEERETAYATARRVGLKAEAERFRRRCARADALYEAVLATLPRIDPAAPNASAGRVVAWTAAHLAQARRPAQAARPA